MIVTSLTQRQLHKDLLTNCRFCVLCGKQLEKVGRQMKGCPDDGHGLLEIQDGLEGLPAAQFQFGAELFGDESP